MVPDSTPVVAFGDPSQAEVATLGINPSAREFTENGELLSGRQRRLATLESLGATTLAGLTDEQVAAVVADCAAYFERRPYRRWFDPLDDLLRHATVTSYYERSACHLDLVQWATDPIWGRIPEAGIRRELLGDGIPHLRAQLSHDNVRLILLNGRQVLDQVRSLQLAELDEVGRIPQGRGDCRLYSGVGEGIRWVGSSTNLQSSWGVSRAFKAELGDWLQEACAVGDGEQAEARPGASVELDADGHLPGGLRVGGKAELVEVLRRWLTESEAATIGDVGSFGGRAWLFVDVRGEEVVLNADTKRGAVMTFVNESAADPERPWRVIANRRGRFNKVVPGPGADPIPGWYAYLTTPRPEAGEL